MKTISILQYLFVLLFVARGVASSQPISNKFIDALIYDKLEITDYVNSNELVKSERLGIQYNGVKNKLLIGNDIPEEIKAGIKNGKYKYDVTEKPIEDSYVEVTFKVPDANYNKVFYFNDGFVTSSTYISRNWVKKESKYFSFRLQEPKYFNEYCIKRLDQFVDMVADTLGFTISERRILENEKIGYIFCADENEVKNITGFSAKGMAMLSTDEVVTSYQTHFHEVAHILVNYKLKNLGLYTLPFFMEGFAVAMGGRGGMAPRVVTDIGYYLQKTGFLTYDSILTNDAFYSQDANMTYAVSGLYNSFLLSELGGEKYLELYEKVNGGIEYVKGIKSNYSRLPDINKWNSFLQFYEKHPDYYFDEEDTIKWRIRAQDIGNMPVSKNKDWTKYFVDDYFFLQYDILPEKQKYSSKLLINMFPEDSVEANNPEEYGIFVDSSSLTVVNFFNDEIVIKYDKAFAIIDVNIPWKNYWFEFFIRDSMLNKFNVKELVYFGVRLKTYINKYLNK